MNKNGKRAVRIWGKDLRKEELRDKNHKKEDTF